MRTKSWPFWETWKSIFGKDRASGGGAEQVDAAAELLNAQAAGGSQVNENDYRPSYEDGTPVHASEPYVQPVDLNDDSSGNCGKQASTTKLSSHKGKQVSSDTVMMEFLSNLHVRLEMIAARIGYEFDLGKARQEVFDKLGDVEGLTRRQRYQLCNILGDKPQRLEVFIGMPANARLEYLLMLIEDSL